MQKCAVCKNLAGVLCKADEKIELLRRKVRVLTADYDAMLSYIDDEVAESDNRLHLAGGSDASTQLCADAGQQLLNAERLGDIVIRTSVQRLNLHTIMVADGQNKNGNLGDDTNLTA